MRQLPLRRQGTTNAAQEESEVEQLPVREASLLPTRDTSRQRTGKLLFHQERGKAQRSADLSAHVKATRTLMMDSFDKLSRLIEDREKCLADMGSDLSTQNELHMQLPGAPEITEPGVPEKTAPTALFSKQFSFVSSCGTNGGRASTGKGDEAGRSLIKQRGRLRNRPVFGMMNSDTLKEQLKEKLSKGPHGVEQFYYDAGIAQQIARAPYFEWITTFFLVANSIWIGIETDLNEAVSLAAAAPGFIVVENLFCTYFLGEWVVRVFAFKRKVDCLRDSWLMFDTVLMSLMVAETWILCPISAAAGGQMMPGMGMMGVFRALRLSRMARMARLVKFFPELAVIIKAVRMGISSICWMLAVLMIVVYIFAILFTQLLDGKSQPKGTVAHESFSSVKDSISTLLLAGVLPDQAEIVKELGRKNFAYYLLMFAYMLFASIVIFNLIVGTLVEVVHISSHMEHEEIDLLYLRQNLEDIMTALDMDNNGNLSKAEFEEILTNTTYANILADIGIDVLGLVDMVDIIFEDDDVELTLENFVKLIFRMRDTNTATVKDLSENSRKVVADIKQEMKALQHSNTLS